MTAPNHVAAAPETALVSVSAHHKPNILFVLQTLEMHLSLNPAEQILVQFMVCLKDFQVTKSS